MGVEGEGKIQAAGNRNEHLRKVAGLTRMDHIRNEEIRHRLQQRSIVDVVRERRERWRVHEGDGETRKFSGKGNGGRDRRKAAQRKTQEAVVGQCFLMQGR